MRLLATLKEHVLGSCHAYIWALLTHETAHAHSHHMHAHLIMHAYAQQNYQTLNIGYLDEIQKPLAGKVYFTLVLLTWGPGDSDLLCGPTAKEERKR